MLRVGCRRIGSTEVAGVFTAGLMSIGSTRCSMIASIISWGGPPGRRR